MVKMGVAKKYRGSSIVEAMQNRESSCLKG